MRGFLASSASLAALLVTAVASNAGTLIPIVPVTGSTSTNVFGINDTLIIDGSYISSQDALEHGYFGPLDGSNYATIDAPAGKTEPRAISNDSTIAGFANNDGVPNDFVPFERSVSGKIKTVDSKKEKPLNYLVQGIANSNDEFAGSYYNKSLALVGYLGKKAEFTKGVSLSITNMGVAPRAVDSAGDIVGWYYDANGVQNGFLISGGSAITVDDPDPTEVSSVLEAINDNGTLTGQWTDTGGIVHAFTYKISAGTFKAITVPNSTVFTQAWGINSAGLVAVGSDQGYFIYCPGTKNCPVDGIKTTDAEIRVPLEKLPHVPCVNGCLSPLAEAEARAPVAPLHVAVQTQASGRPQPMQP